ncbi:hypothetical protein Glove_59g63 [Diversispora epigaea]|uniref:Uncharacterized protein n=1 Tax=Diversispora epigaea TaxID=1348612 RepID=A0A397JBY0_9GLOM|nr:hypothetical protein Glove_59g63 [Diversispora epigaea]
METSEPEQQIKRKHIEIHDYPNNSIIKYSEPGRSYTYDIIKEGLYPPSYLIYTKGINGYRSCSDAANLYAKTRYSGPHLFGLHLEILQQIRDNHQRATVLKPFNCLTPRGQNNRSKQIAKFAYSSFNQIIIGKSHTNDNPSLKSIEFSIKDKSYHISFGKENVEETIHNARAVVQACDENQITRDGYRTLASINQDLPREWKVAAEKKEITRIINEMISIILVDIDIPLSNDLNSEVHINDIEIINNIQELIGKGGQRNISDILKYLIPNLIKKKFLNILKPEIYLRISGDGRNVERKINHVMVTFSILNDIENIFRPENHYTILLYPGIEKYEVLHNTLEQIILELKILKDKGLKDNQGREWKIGLYFSSDWKFLSICLGINSANSKYFCPWCEISKEKQVNFSYEWKITIFDMIPLCNWIPDELHIMLRITDVLWRLVIDELKSRNTWNNWARDVIINEMKHKLTVLQDSNLSKLFPNSRATEIRNLWNNFYLLYKAIKNSKTDALQFAKDVRIWLHQFLNPNYPNSISSNHFYQASDITPYIHVLVYYIPEMIHIYHHFGLAAFSCSAVEKKNHLQVFHFFKKTTKDSGVRRKSAILDIFEHENRMLYFGNNNELDLIHKSKRLRV